MKKYQRRLPNSLMLNWYSNDLSGIIGRWSRTPVSSKRILRTKRRARIPLVVVEAKSTMG
jgi:hypothetical protein